MKKFLIAGSSLAVVAAAGSASAVDVTLGGSMDMGVEFGLGKDSPSDLAVSSAFNKISLSIAAAGTTDAGMKYGGSFTLGTAAELEFNAYGTGTSGKQLVKVTVEGAKDIAAAAFNVSGGQAIAAENIVGVKINSTWRSVGKVQEGFGMGVEVMDASNVCKIAGIADATSSGNVSHMTAKGAASTGTGVAVALGGYLPAGKLTAGVVGLTAGATTDQPSGVDFDGTATAVAQIPASVFAGPFMEVKLQSSSTKMVVGAVCLTGQVPSEANFFMDNASKVVTASDASIFIEGGFGKLTLQTGDYAGAVSAVAGAGDQADIDAKGLVVVASGVGLLGANPFVAVDVAPGTTANNLSILTGGNMDFGGVSAAVDVALNSSDVLEIGSWDLGMNYSMGDMALSFATDSSNAWGLSASMAVAGFGVDATFGSDGATDHEKSGISYSVASSTSLNGFGLSLGVDQYMKPTVGLSYALGSLNVYAGYDADDKGGKIGAKLSF